ncbi:GNAT family N-acetyltransferase [Modestobacter sp. I12A-02628]|uniref:GNAT family N-acetyltransferase n=1 Tax=Goekera deserti TaxID=2497753 RepID=A0A7K3W9J5_9ACTN|nr:GNAT family N-acetyltransferase [Goekera deserti]MPQ99864.1 GNAT family N-acetyltransferase [Goekera deserti]NDI50023.1 GNAT family N-acetyltransferase [Goekera deserti]NEL52500.1 GNAT family N-acetyltransferase [Goekera deserti]
MLELGRGSPDRHLAAIAELERQVVDSDGGRPELEWGILRTRPQDAVHDRTATRRPARATPRVTLRDAGPADAGVVARLLRLGFGYEVDDLAGRLADGSAPTLLVERDGAPVGTLRVTGDGADSGVYGFVVDPACRGQGIGRDLLRRVCARLRADGARRVGLEVSVQNEQALGLCMSLGFRPVATEDHHALPVP